MPLRAGGFEPLVYRNSWTSSHRHVITPTWLRGTLRTPARPIKPKCAVTPCHMSSCPGPSASPLEPDAESGAVVAPGCCEAIVIVESRCYPAT